MCRVSFQQRGDSRSRGTRILSTARADVDAAAAAPEGGAPRGDTAHGAASVGGRGDHDGGAGSGPPRVSSPGPRGGCPQSRSMKSACWGLTVPRLSKRLFLKQAKDWSPSDTFPECLPKRRRHSAVLLSNHIINFWTQINFLSWSGAQWKFSGEFFGNVTLLCLSDPRTPVLCRAPSDTSRQGGSRQRDPEARDITTVLLCMPAPCQDRARMTSNLGNYIIIRILKTGEKKKKSEVTARDPGPRCRGLLLQGSGLGSGPGGDGAEGVVPTHQPERLHSPRSALPDAWVPSNVSGYSSEPFILF